MVVLAGEKNGGDKEVTMENWFAEAFRAITRPAVTIIFAAVIAQVVIEGIEAPAWFLSLAIPCIVWWFGERTIMHKKERDNVF